MAPRYLPDLWNQHLSARHNEPRMNNTTEAWHNRFQVMMAEQDTGKTIRQRRRQEYRRINERLQNLAARYGRYKEEDPGGGQVEKNVYTEIPVYF
ncbi:Protein transport protein sec23 [Frankliniella fusca]|uniref:Protein transport protein sec23 n=1 Tax=Frankliniella fusca TaxID=407009 RepID=A0AAE1HY08_9NEOP|nr:Protein transport protein sec23 [Frankliniella fusca]